MKIVPKDVSEWMDQAIARGAYRLIVVTQPIGTRLALFSFGEGDCSKAIEQTFPGSSIITYLPLPIWTIYEKPSDHPALFVVRRSFLQVGDDEPVCDGYAVAASTLEDARKVIPRDRVRMQRYEADDPVIVEVWI